MSEVVHGPDGFPWKGFGKASGSKTGSLKLIDPSSIKRDITFCLFQKQLVSIILKI